MEVNRLNPVQKATYFLKKSKCKSLPSDNFRCVFTISGIKILSSDKAAIRLSMAPIRTQCLYKPSLLICMDIHPNPGPISVNNLSAPVHKLYNQTRRINSHIVRSKHRLQIFHSHIHSVTLPKGYNPNINLAIGSNSHEFQNDWENNLCKYGNEQLKLSINETNKLIDSLTTQSN